MSIFGLSKIFAYNVPHGYILDNTPMQKLLGAGLNKMGYRYLGDLYIPTCITIVNQTSGDNVRLWSDDPKNRYLDLLEIIMASASLPVVFTPRSVSGVPGVFIDGGTGIDTIPIYPLLFRPNVKSVYIICYSSALTSGGSDLPSPINDIDLLNNAVALFDDMRVDLFLAALEIGKYAPIPTYSFIPTLNRSFSVLDFSDEELEYIMCKQWAASNNPTLLNNF
eukprot:TRINITY_DN1007_c0_g1_i1.p1 TRINITY_DN1007_c0_g1~~TRINITY_DN1007_c0_g1_i1.p1  ORF type:complete len:222 (+),score=29.73 TRINITY_DN1007_c0_g1_i1:178-843(+)